MKRSTWKVLAPGALICAWVSTVQAHDFYRITQIGPIPGMPDSTIIYANGMNDKGEVVGELYGGPNGWIWSKGRFTMLPQLPDAASNYSEPFGLNNKSIVVGVSMNGENSQRPVFWKNAEIHELGFFPDEHFFTLYDINDDGLIVGDLMTEQYGIGDAFIARGNSARLLEPLPGGDGFTFAARINERGAIAGTSNSANGMRGVIWTTSGVRDLGTLPGVTQVFGGDINDFNAVTLDLRYADFTARAAVWRAGQITLLPLLYTGSSASSSAYGINNRGEVCGISSTATGSAPVVWDDGTVLDINDLIAPGDPLKPYVHVVFCQDVNNSGQLLVQGSDSRTSTSSNLYLLTPVRH